MDLKIANTERLEFKNRFLRALTDAGVEPRAAVLAREFNLRANGATVTSYAARKWLCGEAFPTQDRLHVLAGWLKVSPQWLRFGNDADEEIQASNDLRMIPHDEVILLGDFRRLDDRSQAVVRDLIRSLLIHRY